MFVVVLLMLMTKSGDNEWGSDARDVDSVTDCFVV